MFHKPELTDSEAKKLLSSLKTHEVISISRNCKVMRVWQGWIYIFEEQSENGNKNDAKIASTTFVKGG